MRGVIGVVAVLMVLHNFLFTPPPQISPGLAVLALMAVVARAGSVTMPGFGGYSAAAGPVLALALVPGGAAAATLALLAGGLVWAGRAGKQHHLLQRLLSEDLPPILAVAAIVQLQRHFPTNAPLPLLVGPIVQAVLALTLPKRLCPPLNGGDRFAFRRVSRSTYPLQLAAALGCLPLTALAGTPWALAGASPLLWGLQRAAANEFFRINSALALEARAAMQETQDKLRKLYQEKDRVQAELQATDQERRGLEAFARLLSQKSDLNSLGNLIFDTLGQGLKAQSLVIFEGQLPVLYRSPKMSRLQEAPLTGMREPIVAEVLATGQPVLTLRPGEAAFNQILGEKVTLGLPLGPRHVLYIGRNQPEFEPPELRWASWLSRRAGAALAAIQGQLAQKQELEQQSAARVVLQEQVGWLEALLELSRQVSGTVDRATILQRTQAAVQAIVPCDGLVCSQDLHVLYRWGELPQDWLESLRQAAQTVVQFAKPLLVEDTAGGKFMRPNGPKSLLGVPLVSDGVTGALLLASSSVGSFNRQHQDLIGLVAGHSAVALAKAGLFLALQESQAQVVQTSKLMAVGQLAAGVAHELNTPLGAISLMLEGAQGQLQKAPDNAARKLERAQNALGRAKTIVEKLLVYSRKSEPEATPISPADVVNEAADFLEPQLEKQGITLKRLVETTPAIIGKSQDLQQILINLMLNAAEAVASSASKEITVGCRGSVELFVEDRGEGIPPEVLTRIFEPFYTTRPVGKGTGLGLSISQQIAHQHGGRLHVTSTPGQGSRFTLRLPPAP